MSSLSFILGGGAGAQKSSSSLTGFFPSLFLRIALATAWEREDVHLDACPCGADHVARVPFGHIFPGAGGI